MTHKRTLIALLFAFASTAALAAACGSRTGLLVDTLSIPDAGIDVPEIPDVRHIPDVVPPIDVADVTVVNNCPDAGATLVYVVTEENELYSFYPPTLEFKRIGVINCPTGDQTANPFSMAVDRTGVAYVVFNGMGLGDGQLFRVSTATASCTATAYARGQQGFFTFGMGYSADLDGGETLFVTPDIATGGVPDPAYLGTIDTTNFTLNVTGQIAPAITLAELTGTGAGQLFAFYTKTGITGSFVGQIDVNTATVIGETALPSVTQGQGWAFAFWGGDFWLFTAPDPTTTTSQVTRFSPTDGSVQVVATLPSIIVGAGVSTCAPVH